jgi:protoheme IX farnesyltransferase
MAVRAAIDVAEDRGSTRAELAWSAATLADLIALTKPRITSLVLATTMGGLWLGGGAAGRGGVSAATLALTLVGTALVVSGANALNMYLERDTDALMERTCRRPLPDGRLPAWSALALGVALGLAALPILTFGVNPPTGLLAAIALVSYVLLYTPLKRRTTAALLVGAVPGAIPPLLGWTASSGTIEWPGLALFGVLFLWQVPHFLAIATFRRDDYGRAGLKVLPVVRGDRVTRWHIVAYLVPLVAVSLSLAPVGGALYVVSALVLGLGFFGVGAWGLHRSAGVRWARWLFAVSIFYLVLLFASLMIGA